jgi:hypothetical protein
VTKDLLLSFWGCWWDSVPVKLLNLEPQPLAGHRLKADLSSLLCRLYRAAYFIEASNAENQWLMSASKVEVKILCKVIKEVASYLPALFS